MHWAELTTTTTTTTFSSCCKRAVSCTEGAESGWHKLRRSTLSRMQIFPAARRLDWLISLVVRGWEAERRKGAGSGERLGWMYRVRCKNCVC